MSFPYGIVKIRTKISFWFSSSFEFMWSGQLPNPYINPLRSLACTLNVGGGVLALLFLIIQLKKLVY